jgi:hypothetical protein
MTRLGTHLKSNAIAYAALFVALGGTSYAAVNLPNGSVGTRQIRNSAVTNKKIANGSLTPAKFSGKNVNGSIAMWARISATGVVVASKPHATVIGYNPATASGRISWGRSIPVPCFSLATVDGLPGGGFASVATLNQPHPPAYVVFHTFSPGGELTSEPVNVAVVCP